MHLPSRWTSQNQKAVWTMEDPQYIHGFCITMPKYQKWHNVARTCKMEIRWSKIMNEARPQQFVVPHKNKVLTLDSSPHMLITHTSWWFIQIEEPSAKWAKNFNALYTFSAEVFYTVLERKAAHLFAQDGSGEMVEREECVLQNNHFFQNNFETILF